MWSTRSRTWERVLVSESEAFLLGHYAQYLGLQHRPVPAWAWLNALAHGGEADISSLATSEPPRRALPSDTTVWQQALAFLAQELISQAARRGRPVADLQRSMLVPIELELAGRPAQSSIEPGTVVSRVLTVLAQHPTSQRRNDQE